jgi:uncharacterized protein (TIGR02265 family)
MLRVIGPRRAVTRMDRNFRTGFSQVDCGFEAPGPNEVRIDYRPTLGVEGYFQGAMQAGLQLVGGHDVKAEILQSEGDRVLLRLTWRD